MKVIILICFWMAGISALLAQDTAYTAIRAVQAKLGKDAMNQLAEVRGTRGDPQPRTWTVIMKDPAARGGVREVVVENGAIVSERTPLRGYSGVVERPGLNFSQLNLDSNGAFKIAESEAVKAKIGFHWVDYTLRSHSVTGVPIWILSLIDYNGAEVGTMQVSARDQTITQGLKAVDPDRARDRAYVESSTSGNNSSSTSDSSGQSWDERGGLIGVVEGTAKRTGNTIKRGTYRVIGNVQEFLTGERTVGEEE